MSLLSPEAIELRELPTVTFGTRSELPDVPAVYFVLDGECQVQYVGRSKRLNFRWRSHHRMVAFQQLANFRIAYLALEDASL